jgi:hypothetical protein
MPIHTDIYVPGPKYGRMRSLGGEYHNRHRYGWFVVHWRRSRAAGEAAQHSHGITYSHAGEPTAVTSMQISFQRPVPVTPGQHLLCTSLITRGEGETTAAQSAPHTPSLDPTPFLCEAKLSEAKLWPCPTHSLPPSPSPQAHTPLQPLGGPVHRRPHPGALSSGRAWRQQGAKTRGEERRGEERVVGAAEGPARVHVTRQGHRRHGQGKRAPTQDPPALHDHTIQLSLPGDVMCVLVFLLVWVCEGAQFVRVCMDGCVYL